MRAALALGAVLAASAVATLAVVAAGPPPAASEAPAPAIPAFRLGDRATYVSDDGEKAVHVTLRGFDEVLDAGDAPQRVLAFELDFHLPHGIVITEYVDATTGAYVAAEIPCPECGRVVAYLGEGTPGAWGRGALEALGGTREGDGCVRPPAPGGSGGFLASRGLFCADASFPKSFGGVEWTRTEFVRGGGETVPVSAAERVVRPADLRALPWDGRALPGDPWRQEGLSAATAWSWASRESEALRSFLAENPEARFVGTDGFGWGHVTTQAFLDDPRGPRLLAMDSTEVVAANPDGSGLHVAVERASLVEGVTPAAWTQGPSGTVETGTTFDPRAPPPAIVSERVAVERALQRIRADSRLFLGFDAGQTEEPVYAVHAVECLDVDCDAAAAFVDARTLRLRWLFEWAR